MTISNRDNALRTARNLGRLSGSRRIGGAVGRRDAIDFAKFTLSELSDVGLTIGRIAGRASAARVSLRDSRGAIIRSVVSGANARTITSKLAAGTYYFSVQRLRGEVNYLLTASARQAEPGEGLGTSRDIGVLSGTYTNQEFIGTPDLSDLYKFTLNDVSNLQARVNSSAARTELELIQDSNFNGLIDSGEVISTGTDFSAPYLSSVTEDLPPGTYYARVVSSSSRTPTQYQISLVATPFGGNMLPEPGNTLPTARDLGAIAGTVLPRDYVGKVDAIDYYRVTLNDITNLQLNVRGSSTNTEVQLIKDTNNNGLVDNGEILASDTNFSSNFLSTITQDVPSGVYFIGVKTRSTSVSTSYELGIVATPYGGTLSPDPGNTLPAARDLGVLSGTFTARDHVGITDRDDFYRFTLNTTTTLQARVNAASTNTEIQLIQDLNSNGLIDNGETLASDTNFSSTFISQINRSVPAGTYFFRVIPRGISASTNYALSLTA